ncbi:unnamed protein product, partial [Effrenium voratum]
EDSLGIRLSQPAGARHFGEATPATDVGDDSQDWAVFNGDCETVNSRLPHLTYRRCSDGVSKEPWGGYDTVQLQAVHSNGFYSMFSLSMGISEVGTLDDILKLGVLSPNWGSPSGGEEVNVTVPMLYSYNDTQ